jgi:hypothetical protein
VSASQFVQRVINVAITIGTGTNGEDGSETTTLYGARVLAQIQKTGAPGVTLASIRIFGLSLDHMNRISSLGLSSYRDRNNTVSLMAGDAGGMAVVFTGKIYEAYADFNAMPDVCFTIEAQPLLIAKLKPIAPTSYAGPVDVVTVLSGLATQINYTLENNGVSVILRDVYYWGTAIDQAYDAAQAANIYLFPDDATQRLAIWPRDGFRGGSIPLISPTTGLVGYPNFVSNALSFRVLYNPSILFGGMVKVESSLPAASGNWIINRLSHRLETQQINGAWFSDVEGYRLGNTNPNIT